ncbi:MAG: CPBP family glutamic-type intramembrane protease [Gemmatimonadaceae bacterium]
MKHSGYWEATRAPRYSLTFALPLLLLYEALAAALTTAPSGGIRNGADVILRSLFALSLGRWGPAVFGAALVGSSAWLAGRDLRRSGAPRRGFFVGMAAEAIVLALVFGAVVGTITAHILHAVAPFALALSRAAQLGPWARLMVSLGAGLYEELLFRVLLVTFIAAVIRLVIRLPSAASGSVAVVMSALIFSAFHYVGPYGDTFRADSFAFRAIAGLFFSALYLLRGFGITAWTHALYDIFVMNT